MENPEDPIEIENDMYNDEKDQVYTYVQNEYTQKMMEFIYDNEGMLEDMFGVNVAVYVTKDKIVTEEYDCGY